MNRRVFMAVAAAGAAKFGEAQDVPDAIKKLKPMLDGVVPVTDAERRARIDKAQRLMRENKLDAILLESGTSMFYFTGTGRSATDRTAALVIPAKGELSWVVPNTHLAHEEGAPTFASRRTRLTRSRNSRRSSRIATRPTSASKSEYDSAWSTASAAKRPHSNFRAPKPSPPDAA